MKQALRASEIIAHLQQFLDEGNDPLVLVTKEISFPIDAPIVGFSNSVVGQHPQCNYLNLWNEEELSEKFPGTPVEPAIVLLID